MGKSLAALFDRQHHAGIASKFSQPGERCQWNIHL